MGQDLDRDLFFLMHDVARLVRVEADRRARLHGLTRAQWGVLLRLARNPGLSQKEIADLLEVEPISVARLVDRLEAANLVERRPDADDRRVWRLHLRDAAAAILDSIKEQREDMGNAITAGVAMADRETIVKALLIMKTNLLRAGEASPDKPDQERQVA